MHINILQHVHSNTLYEQAVNLKCLKFKRNANMRHSFKVIAHPWSAQLSSEPLAFTEY